MTSLYKCNAIFSRIMSITSNINYYDIRKKCEGNLCYDFSNVETFLNKKTVTDALGVRNLDFVSCSSTVYDAMLQDWMRNIEVGIPALLEDGIQVLVYAGEEDLICNWLDAMSKMITENASEEFLHALSNYCALQGFVED